MYIIANNFSFCASQQIFRKLFEDGLEIQRANIRELKTYAKQKSAEYASKLQDNIDSLENLYPLQPALCVELSLSLSPLLLQICRDLGGGGGGG